MKCKSSLSAKAVNKLNHRHPYLGYFCILNLYYIYCQEMLKYCIKVRNEVAYHYITNYLLTYITKKANKRLYILRILRRARIGYQQLVTVYSTAA